MVTMTPSQYDTIAVFTDNLTICKFVYQVFILKKVNDDFQLLDIKRTFSNSSDYKVTFNYI